MLDIHSYLIGYKEASFSTYGILTRIDAKVYLDACKKVNSEPEEPLYNYIEKHYPDLIGKKVEEQ